MTDRTRTAETPSLDVLIVGAGFAGLYLVHRLTQLGFSARVIEAGRDVGGTWYWNRYPGARCDVESFFYSYSFDPQLEQDWRWSERYPAQPEILAYLRHVADRFDLRRQITFDTRVIAATFDDLDSTWTARTDAGDEITARFLMLATGPLSAARTPDIAGLENFAGEVLHTAYWPEDGVDLTGKRVGIIGTGSSGIQVMPEIAKEAAATVVVQRTANFLVPSWNRPLTEDEQRDVRARYRELREQSRLSPGGLPFARATESALEVDDAERLRRYEDAWAYGSASRFVGTFADLLTDLDANATAADFVRVKIRELVHDPETAARLCPTTHPLGTKRLPQDIAYFEAFNDPRVSLVDLTETPIDHIAAEGVVTTAGVHRLDVLVFATGFDALSGAILKIEITRSDGVRLAEHWAAGPRTYLGMAIAGFPNLFTLSGPGSPSVLSNVPVSIELQVEWLSDLMVHLRESERLRIEATRAAEDEWQTLSNRNVQATLYPSAASWYMGANVPGKPRVFLPFVGGVDQYRQLCDNVARDGYRGFELSGAMAAEGRPAVGVSRSARA
jgi:cyclohexanone monooxygenase